MIGPDRQQGLWEYKEQTRIKHAILSNYLKRWMAILGRPRASKPRRMHFVDSYAGRAKYAGGEPGSPIRAMEVGEELHHHFKGAFFLECHNVERDPFNFASLRWQVEVAKQDFPSVEARNYEGAFEDRLGDVFANIGPGEPALVFLDPFGYQGIDMPNLIAMCATPPCTNDGRRTRPCGKAAFGVCELPDRPAGLVHARPPNKRAASSSSPHRRPRWNGAVISSISSLEG